MSLENMIERWCRVRELPPPEVTNMVQVVLGVHGAVFPIQPKAEGESDSAWFERTVAPKLEALAEHHTAISRPLP